MTIESMFHHSLEVRRAATADPATVDDWNRPTYAADTVIATVPGQVQPLSFQEVAALADAGAVVGDYKAYLRPTDVLPSDRIRRVDTDEMFEIRAVKDAAGIGHHLELLLHRVVSA